MEVVGNNLPEGMRTLVSQDGDIWSEESGEAVNSLWVLLRSFLRHCLSVALREIWGGHGRERAECQGAGEKRGLAGLVEGR